MIRAERFDDVLNFIERNKSKIETEIPNKILIFQKALCLQKDSGCHEILEMDEDSSSSA